jgi:hypothetical protein
MTLILYYLVCMCMFTYSKQLYEGEILLFSTLYLLNADFNILASFNENILNKTKN